MEATRFPRGDLPCTALTFVRNSAATLEACLQSGLFCAEHVLLDGGSTDATLEIAARFGCRVVPQDKKFLNAEGRIIDYAGITNQGIAAAAHPWVTIIDSDEYIDRQLVDAMTEHVKQNVPGAYYVDRLYTLDGRVIRYASTYPNRQIRLWHGDAINGFVKFIHERPDLKPGIKPTVLPGIQYVPLEPAADMRRKFRRYLDLEARFAGGYGWAAWLRLVWNKLSRMALRVLRIIKARLTHRWSDCLPLSYEYLHLWYPWRIVVETCPLVFNAKAKLR